jgi:hypothetical protein
MTAENPTQTDETRREKFRVRARMKIRVRSLADRLAKMSPTEREAFCAGLLRGLRR